jgi:rSAM/selenodomain-associated transferase 2
MQSDQIPELSIIVPVLNEISELPPLFDTLARQVGVSFELILCDGGSSDGTRQSVAELAANSPFAVRSIGTARGRGRQMNAGAAEASGELLLFLHADSRFSDQHALHKAAQVIRERVAGSNTQAIAARFALRFRRSCGSPSLAYFFYEAKARLNRTDCIRGDQGFLIPQTFFHQLGGFDQSLPFLEDVRLAALVALNGEWSLLPAGISTSARRFETEGFYERQVVNAIIANNHVVEWTEFFLSLPGLYSCNAESGRLLLYPLLEGIRAMLAGRPPAWLLKFWSATGRHVASNTWQIFFWLDARRAFRGGRTPDDVSPRLLGIFERRLARLFHTPLAAFVTAGAVWIWFRLLLVRHKKNAILNGSST